MLLTMCFQRKSQICLICLFLSIIPVCLADKTGEHIHHPHTDNCSNVDNTLQTNDSGDMNTDYFVTELMRKYGDSDSVMSYQGFTHLLYHLGIGGSLVLSDHDQYTKKEDHEHNHEHDDHEHGEHEDHEHGEHEDHEHGEHDDHEHGEHEDHEHKEHDDHEHSEHEDHDHYETQGFKDSTTEHPHEHDDRQIREVAEAKDKCLPASTILLLGGKARPQGHITKDIFKELCPILIYQVDIDACHNLHDPNAHLRLHHEELNDGHDHDHKTSTQSKEGLSAKVWGYSCVAVVIISLVGLLGVAVIPIMQKVFYNHMLQFLVALAVGALTGDALMHLLPHAMAGGHEGEHEHGSHDTTPIYKGLFALLGAYFFYIVERLLTIFTESKRRKKENRNRRKKPTIEDESSSVGERLANTDKCDEMMMSIHPNKALKGYADEAHSEHCTISFENSTSISHHHDNETTCLNGGDHEGSEMIRHDDNSNTAVTGHSHKHGHSHCQDGVPKSVSAVAWMVILGDGIHNMTDGLAIGAAFANSLTGGFSTSIAVFCHELPHEIGDFAMLLRAGMSAKQAVFYNCISSVLCFIGLIIGVAIGNVEGASLWIFTIVAGMFLYIALVDMLPEMSSVETKEGEHPLCHLLLQLLGMMLGAGIMFTIAIYEEDLKTIME